MARSAHRPRNPVHENKIIADPARIRLVRLRHIHPLTQERQIALIQTARAIRRCQPSPRLCPVEAAVRDQMLGLLPNLRAFALSLTNDPTRADDLVQDTILRAWANISRFERGTNLGVRLFTILRNSFYTEYRKRRHEVLDSDGTHASRLTAEPEQDPLFTFPTCGGLWVNCHRRSARP